MIKFEDLLARAEIEVLDKMMPSGAGPLIRQIDNNLIYPARLANVLISQISPQSLLLNKQSRGILFDLLPIKNASDLSQRLGNKSQDHYDFLKNHRFTKENEKKILLQYFGVPFIADETALQKEDTLKVSGKYNLFLHQIDALQKVRELLDKPGGRVLLHMPTGSGKTRTAVNFASEYLRNQRKRVVVWLANSEELCEQAFEEINRAWSFLGNREIPCLRYWGQHEPNISELKDGVVVIGLSKAFSKLRSGDRGLHELSATNPLVIFDEAHQVIAKTYRQITDLLIRPQSKAALLGLSATPGRTWNDPAKDEELSRFFNRNKITLEIDGYPNPVNYLIDKGYLARPNFRQIYSAAEIELTPQDEIKIAEFLEIPNSVLIKLGQDQKRNILIVTEAEQLLKQHKRVILFAASVAQSDLLASVLSVRGIKAKSITSNSTDMDRKKAIEEYKRDDAERRILCNYGILTTGFDAPITSAALIARPTMSLVLYSQMVGRALRGINAGGNKEAEIITVIDQGIPEFNSIEKSFSNWEDVWSRE
jgi:superfamily II DNA or RNA helicase